MWFLWILLGVLCVILLISLGVTTLRKGHWVMFLVGIVFPIMWIVGAIIGPASRVTATP